MDDQKKAKDKKPAKKLELNRETVQELSESELDDVAGGGAGTKKNCRSVNVDCPTGPPDQTAAACPPPLTMGQDTCGICPIRG
jgi:natural product precursor